MRDVDLGERVGLFRTSVSASFLFGLLPFALFLVLLGALVDLLSGDVDFFLAYFQHFVIYLVVFSAISLAAIYFYPITVHEKGIHGYGLSSKCKVMWSDMTGAQNIKFLGLFPYVKVTSNDRNKVLYIPWGWLAKESEFKSDVMKTASSDNPLRVFYSGHISD